jgi:hypothetical protein
MMMLSILVFYTETAAHFQSWRRPTLYLDRGDDTEEIDEITGSCREPWHQPG